MMRFIYPFLFLILLACQKEKASQYIVGVSQCSDDLWREAMNEEIKREIAFYPQTQVIIKSTKDNTQQQFQDIEEFINQKVDLLIIAPNEAEALTSVVQKAHLQGIPIILVDRKVKTDNYTAYIGADNYQIGKEAGLYAASVLGGKGNVVEIRGWKGSTPDTERHQGFVDALRNTPEIKIIAEVYGNFLKDDAKNQMISIYHEHETIDLIFALNDRMASGAYEASLLFSGRKPFIIGVDALQNEGVQNIIQGKQNASFLYPTGGDKVVELAMKILQKRPFTKENTLHTTVVDKSNVRVLQLQTEQITEKQAKIDAINQSLNESLVKYTNQRTLFYISVIAIVLVMIFLLITIRAYRTENRARQMLALKNEKIQRQTDILQKQKEQLELITKQLEDTTQAKLVFFTNISHEFKTPLTLILAPVDSLLKNEQLTEKQREMLLLIQKNSHRLLFLISELIEFRSYERGKIKMCFVRADLKIFLEEINIFFENWIKQKNIDFVFRAEATSFEIIFDKEKMEKIYFNLVSNALKFVNYNGKIVISLSKENEGVCLSISNTGSYIPEDKLTDVFEHFYKIDPNSEGSGIGLALTQSLVWAHKGTISVESDRNEGTTFSVHLPNQHSEISEDIYETSFLQTQMRLLAQPSSNNEERMYLSSESTLPDKPLVLIVEDNEDMRKFICHILCNEFNLIEAVNGEEGFKKAKKYTPDLVISDVMMPQKDGFELCQLLKTNLSTNHIPVILLTAYSLDEQKQIGFESGADAYISKPFNTNLLLVRVRKLIENRKKIQEIFSSKLLDVSSKESLGKVEELFINEFKTYVQRQIANPDLNIDEMAEALGLSRSQLYRKIKSLTNYSPNELIRIIRVQQGKQLLMQNTKTISEIAYEIGFSSPSYFAKCFKDLFNESPTEFVEKLK
ncbi:substrate-binding domain-containing protein [Capnocytophaga cynodegmi]|uniref:substrate-binding domain-containing protein n=1 Tax=Capnocytophaga cynodegmi TaxID=28189 RepID=UPI001E5DA829|nr:substrate-binding domain-containing protein [Capnocytophaga cynodegmi]